MCCPHWNKQSKVKQMFLAEKEKKKKIQLVAMLCTDQKSILENGLSKNKLTMLATWTFSVNLSSAVFNPLQY